MVNANISMVTVNSGCHKHRGGVWKPTKSPGFAEAFGGLAERTDGSRQTQGI